MDDFQKVVSIEAVLDGQEELTFLALLKNPATSKSCRVAISFSELTNQNFLSNLLAKKILYLRELKFGINLSVLQLDRELEGPEGRSFCHV